MSKEQTLEEIVERVSKETNIAYDEYSEEHTDILRKALTSYAEVRVKEERNRVYNYCLENVADKAGLLEINQLLDVIKGNEVEYKEWHTLLTKEQMDFTPLYCYNYRYND